jgi:predicted nucleotidyltransferase
LAGGDDGAYVRLPEIEDLVRICRSLNDAGARYLLIGGFAVIAHGLGRTTKDIDFLVDDAPENIARVKIGLDILADQAAREIDDGDVRRYTVVRVADEILVDLLGRACGVSYSDAIADAEIVELGGVTIPLVSKRTLIRTKDTVRPSDHADRQFLEALLRSAEKR